MYNTKSAQQITHKYTTSNTKVHNYLYKTTQLTNKVL